LFHEEGRRRLLDCRDRAGAINIPYRSMNAETAANLPKEKLMVTYCSGPGCNGCNKGALKLASLGFRVKELIGGLEYWVKGSGQVEGTLDHEADRPRELRGVA
jgi:rhodanese-related sulfurtransferase